MNLPYENEVVLGFPAGTAAAFLREMNLHRVNLHSLLLMRHGKVFCEEYAPGYDENFRHRLYSVSKTYVSAAVGVAIGEGYFTLESNIADFFPDKLPADPHPYLKALTVRDCLMMATPFNETPYRTSHTDWVLDFFQAECTHRGGSIFHYDTGASLVLDALVERVTGLPFNEYLFNKVLSKIGYETVPPCVEAPDGTKWGGSGMQCTTREFAAFARLWMNDGKSEDGEQLIPADYIREAVKKQIGNAEDNAQNSLRGMGYGFQTWRLKYGWAMFGMGNQLAFCFPREDVLMICTGDDQANDFARNYIVDVSEKLLLKPLGGAEETAEPVLGMPLPFGEKESPLQSRWNGVTYRLQPNRMGMEWVRFTFGDTCKMTFFARGEEKTILFGLGAYREFAFPETGYSGDRINTPIGRGYRSFAAGAWDLPDLLVMKCYLADTYFGNFTANFRFCEQGMDFHITKCAEWFLDEYHGFATGVAE